MFRPRRVHTGPCGVVRTLDSRRSGRAGIAPGLSSSSTVVTSETRWWRKTQVETLSARVKL